ncbi:MAG: cobalamin-dependent protein [Candidatus Cloacimonetes bacterium]|nr:cobalamin-dependent protein [Candidatus Cloacimonadota bacterium]
MLTNKDYIANQLKARKSVIAERTFEARKAINTNMEKRYREKDIPKFYADCSFHVDFLSQAISYESPVIFTDYLLWTKRLFQHLPISSQSLVDFFHTFAVIVSSEVDPEHQYGLKQYMDTAMLKFHEPLCETTSFLDTSSPYGILSSNVLALLLAGDKDKATNYILDMVQSGTSIRDCYINIIQPLQYEVGRLWHEGKISVGQEHYVTAASQVVMSQFYSAIMDHPDNHKRIVSACISGEQHEVGLRMVSDLMELEGWDTMFLGANTPLETIPETTLAWKADLLAISVTLAIHLDKLSELIKLCRVQIPHLKVMVGGYPFNLDPELWRKIGADGFANNALNAISTAESLIS